MRDVEPGQGAHVQRLRSTTFPTVLLCLAAGAAVLLMTAANLDSIHPATTVVDEHEAVGSAAAGGATAVDELAEATRVAGPALLALALLYASTAVGAAGAPLAAFGRRSPSARLARREPAPCRLRAPPA